MTDLDVSAQYEKHPYPPRNPDDEHFRLIVGSPSHLDEINHYIFGGRRDFKKPFRALIAGGGTGDATVMLAQQLAERGPGEVVYVDISKASMEIARARIAARGLTNVAFHQGSLMNIGDIDSVPFDYIDCCGVLHHLSSPQEGLKKLIQVLNPDGGLGIMLYGALGRTGVYPLQDAIRSITSGLDGDEQLRVAKILFRELPESNWLKLNGAINDHLVNDDSAFTDLLLHRRDRAYTVPEIWSLTSGLGLAITGFIEPIRYEPETYLKDRVLIDQLQKLDWAERCALAESISGNLKTHIFYAVPSNRSLTAVASLDAANAVALWRNEGGAEFSQALKKSAQIKVNFDGLLINFTLPDDCQELVRLINNNRTLGDIQKLLKLDWFTFKSRFDRLYYLLNGLNLLLLKID